MGSRGAFVDFYNNNFSFIENGQKYITLGIDEDVGVKYLIQTEGSVKVPDFSHSADTIYAVIQKGQIKSIGVYENHIKIKSYDLQHTHYVPELNKTLGHHYHTDLHHTLQPHELTKEDEVFINKVIGGFKKYAK